MAKNETIHIRVKDNVKAQAEETLGLLGLSISDAVNMLLHQITLVGGLPFDVRIPLSSERSITRTDDQLHKKTDAG